MENPAINSGTPITSFTGVAGHGPTQGSPLGAQQMDTGTGRCLDFSACAETQTKAKINSFLLPKGQQGAHVPCTCSGLCRVPAPFPPLFWDLVTREQKMLEVWFQIQLGHKNTRETLAGHGPSITGKAFCEEQVNVIEGKAALLHRATTETNGKSGSDKLLPLSHMGKTPATSWAGLM